MMLGSFSLIMVVIVGVRSFPVKRDGPIGTPTSLMSDWMNASVDEFERRATRSGCEVLWR